MYVYVINIDFYGRYFNLLLFCFFSRLSNIILYLCMS